MGCDVRNWAKFTDVYGRDLHIDADEIVAIEEHVDKTSTIYIRGGKCFSLNTNQKQLLDVLRGFGTI